MKPIDVNVTMFIFIETHEQIDDGAFPAARMTDQCNGFTCIRCEGNVFQHIRFPIIGKRHIAEFDFPILNCSIAPFLSVQAPYPDHPSI